MPEPEDSYFALGLDYPIDDQISAYDGEARSRPLFIRPATIRQCLQGFRVLNELADQDSRSFLILPGNRFIYPGEVLFRDPTDDYLVSHGLKVASRSSMVRPPSFSN